MTPVAIFILKCAAAVLAGFAVVWFGASWSAAADKRAEDEVRS